ncbi:hypothetical protein QUF64_00955 [Anaerolineales bacterium HSG6]|nr:hypothetical protein [Anaerolineales bacterium HSG6]
MLTFLFWNVNNKSLQENIVRLVQNHRVDVLMLAEYDDTIPIGNILSMLNRGQESLYHYVPNNSCKRVHLITRFNDSMMPSVYEDTRSVYRHLTLPGLPEILLVVSHLPSKLYHNDSDQISSSIHFAQKIRQTETQIGHTRTLLVGDLNMNPFEYGITSVSGLNATMSRRKAMKAERKSNGVQYPYFYNPMWNLFGDVTPGPPGTYHYNSGANSWHIFDQMMLRPALLNHFNSHHIQILETDGEESLLSTQGLPKQSDHLPILFALEL